MSTIQVSYAPDEHRLFPLRRYYRCSWYKVLGGFIVTVEHMYACLPADLEVEEMFCL